MLTNLLRKFRPPRFKQSRARHVTAQSLKIFKAREEKRLYDPKIKLELY